MALIGWSALGLPLLVYQGVCTSTHISNYMIRGPWCQGPYSELPWDYLRFCVISRKTPGGLDFRRQFLAENNKHHWLQNRLLRQLTRDACKGGSRHTQFRVDFLFAEIVGNLLSAERAKSRSPGLGSVIPWSAISKYSQELGLHTLTRFPCLVWQWRSFRVIESLSSTTFGQETRSAFQ